MNTINKDLNNYPKLKTSTYLNSLGDVANDFHLKNNKDNPSKLNERYIPVPLGVEEIRNKALKTEYILKLFDNHDLIINKLFDLEVRERKSIGKPHLKKDESVLIKGVDFTKVIRKVDADAQIMVLTKHNLEITNENIKIHKEEIKESIKQIIMNAMYYNIITQVNINSISQSLYYIGYNTQDVRNFIELGFNSNNNTNI